MVTLTMIHDAASSAAPVAASRVKTGLLRVWRFLEEVGRYRAASQLEHLARGYALSQPELAQHLREAARQCASE
jgi:hypothetical protein